MRLHPEMDSRFQSNPDSGNESSKSKSPKKIMRLHPEMDSRFQSNPDSGNESSKSKSPKKIHFLNRVENDLKTSDINLNSFDVSNKKFQFQNVSLASNGSNMNSGSVQRSNSRTLL
eukprot:CAMPEP_0170567466 /NCGR_PEP_ID=MMETSP0211-20121228/80500_1 /TAXON_ID=311385 /ORGANISM="Pseudokeronopsis sp., Strain OXSARD2" /LENGTH=115 /DNA_ID=CAMNT_0010888935 /DNA_START=349 /DNA_END=696 /DNA_ORIENTATION=-